jgi:hypothetical protein
VALQEASQLPAKLYGSPVVLLTGNLVNYLLPGPGCCLFCASIYRRTCRRHNSGLLPCILKRLDTNHRLCISDEQPVPKVLDVLMENGAQLHEDIPNLDVIVCCESLSTQNRDSFFESHGGNLGRSTPF